MAPTVRRKQRQVARQLPVEPKDFPRWTRGDDSDEEEEAKPWRRLPRGSKKRVQQTSQADDVWLPPEAHVDGTLTTELAETAPPATAPVEEPESPSGEDSVESGIESPGSADETSTAPGAPPTASPSVVAPTSSLAEPQTTTAAGATTIKSTAAGQPPVQTTLQPNTNLPTTTASATLSPSSPQSTETAATESQDGPLTTTVSSLTPTLTDGPALSTRVQKGVEPPPHQGFTNPRQFPYTSTTGLDPDATAAADRAEVYPHNHGMNADTGKALIGIGTTGGVILIAAIVWFIWRSFKRSRARQSSSWISPAPSPDEFNKPSRHIRVLAHIPFIKKRFANRGWFTIDEPYVTHQEKPVVATPRMNSFFPPDKFSGATIYEVYAGEKTDQPQARNIPAHAPNQSFSSTEGQYYNTLPLGTANRRQSEISSLSSGFGDGDIIMPTRNVRHSTASTLQPPPPARHRDTTYTESSDAPPRFRTVNSWVRQQAGRVKRVVVPGGAPPEPEFAMMMPDGEVPRRAEQAYGIAR